MALIRRCCACEIRPVSTDRDLCTGCADTFDAELTGLLEKAAGDD